MCVCACVASGWACIFATTEWHASARRDLAGTLLDISRRCIMDSYKFARTPRRHGGIRSLKATGGRKSENRLFLPFWLVKFSRGHHWFYPPRASRTALIPLSALLAHPSGAVPRIDHEYCPRKITISSRARGSIEYGRHTPFVFFESSHRGEYRHRW